MRRRDFLANGSRLALAACSIPLAVQGQPGLGSASRRTRWRTLISDLETLIPQRMAEAVVPGLSLALVQEGKLLWRRGFGFKDNAWKEPVENDTLFEAASISKTVFAYAVMKLCEKGILALDTPLSQYTPKPFLEGDARLERITARHVLSHTSGFQDWRSKGEPLKIHFAPGERFLYSGEGYYYLQSVLSQLTGQVNPKQCATYEAGLEVCATDIDPYLKRNLLGPFGMDSSGYLWNDSWEQRAARPHDSDGKPFQKKKPTATDVARYGAAGGLHTTPTDYARFLVEIVQPKPSDAFRLAADSLKEMLRPQVKLDDQQKIDGASAWGLGWAIRERPGGNLIVHSGGQDGFRSLTVASPGTRSGFIVLTNGDNGWKVFHHESFGAVMNRLLDG